MRFWVGLHGELETLRDEKFWDWAEDGGAGESRKMEKRWRERERKGVKKGDIIELLSRLLKMEEGGEIFILGGARWVDLGDFSNCGRGNRFDRGELTGWFLFWICDRGSRAVCLSLPR